MTYRNVLKYIKDLDVLDVTYFLLYVTVTLVLINLL